MGIYYDPSKKQWITNWEKVDYTPEELRTDRSEGYSQRYLMQHPCDVRNWLGWCVAEERWGTRWIPDNEAIVANQRGRDNQVALEENIKLNSAYSQTLAIANTTQGGDYVNQRESIRQILNAKALLPENLPTGSALYTPKPTNLGNYEEQTRYASDDPESSEYYARDENGELIVERADDWSGDLRLKRATVTETVWVPNEAENAANQNYNNEQEAISQKNNETNKYNKKFNASLKALSLELEKEFKTFYRTEKLQQWNPALGAKPLYGDFVPEYYKENNPDVVSQWKAAEFADDIDITERYGENNYYWYHYTTQGKPAGLRGNEPDPIISAKAYVEKKPTDQDIQAVRDLQLGVDIDTQTQRLLNIPAVASAWEKAKNKDPYWINLAKEKYLDVTKPDEFAALFRLSERPEDKQIAFNYNANAGYGITELEDAISQAVGEKAVVDVKRFGALTQDVLKQTIEEMKQAKAKEQMLGLMSGFGSFSEITNINKELTNSILGDSGVGGLLSFTSAGKAEESLEKSLQNITGVRNNATYNWQQWFDGELKKRYEQDLELGYTTAEAQDQVKIQADFARQFIDEYLIPRFNTSRSMDEFVEYLDIRQEEQNPFQTQDMVNAVKLVADLRANQYLTDIQKMQDQYFNADFYFNPVGNKAREADYLNQAKIVSEDWEAAKKGDPYWAQQAYRFGIDLNDKDAFARIHFQVKGQGRGFDAAKDILTAGGVQDEIYGRILPALKEEALKQGTVFGQFVLPEEFADEMLRGLDPSDKSTWEEVLKRYGLTDFKGDIQELKNYIVETLRTGTAQDIREQIKYLNEKRQKPTQEVLGVTYIERPEDYTDKQAKPSTELYSVFQKAGYQGTEDEFYQNFFPDLDRSEQTILTKAGSNEALKTYGLDFSDPFASLGTVESFFTDEEEPSTTDKEKSSNFFSLKLNEDEEETNYKSKTGTQILGEFTSMFKGL